MSQIQVDDILKQIIDAIKGALGDKFEEAKDFAESEAKKFAINIAEIVLWKEQGKITEEQAKVLIRMHQRSMKMVLTALEGISLVIAERAINAAIGAIKGIVNRIIGFQLL